MSGVSKSGNEVTELKKKKSVYEAGNYQLFSTLGCCPTLTTKKRVELYFLERVK